MINIILNGLLKFIVNIANIGLGPINSLLYNAFPDLTEYMNDFANLLNNYVAPIIGWFIALIPPKTKALIGIYIATVVGLYIVSLTIQGIVKVFKLIQNIKIW